MAGSTAPCLCERVREALQVSIFGRTGGLLNRLSVACRNERIVIEASCRSYHSLQLILSAIAATSEAGREMPIDLTARVNGRSLTLHLAPATSPSTLEEEGASKRPERSPKAT